MWIMNASNMPAILLPISYTKKYHIMSNTKNSLPDRSCAHEQSNFVYLGW